MGEEMEELTFTAEQSLDEGEFIKVVKVCQICQARHMFSMNICQT